MEENREILVSIIIPVYQAKDTLDRCVLSCLNQKFVKKSEIEVILVDDGSTDGSFDICDRLAGEDEHGRVHVVHTENHGVSHARNVGLEHIGDSEFFTGFLCTIEEVQVIGGVFVMQENKSNLDVFCGNTFCQHRGAAQTEYESQNQSHYLFHLVISS